VTDDDLGSVAAVRGAGSVLVATSASFEMRRALGPAAWSALEVLALRAEREPDGTLIATLGVKELAGLLGVGRDASARALVALREHGLVSATQHRAGKGRFDRTRHTILLPLGIEVSPAPRIRPRASRSPQLPEPQPSLFDDPPHPRDEASSARDHTVDDHSDHPANDVPRKLHELAFDRIPTPPGQGGMSC
jgi:hypothetical protein